jgi:hypothetical protein
MPASRRMRERAGSGGGLSQFVRSDTLPEAERDTCSCAQWERQGPRREELTSLLVWRMARWKPGLTRYRSIGRRRGWRHRCPLAISLFSRFFPAPVLVASRYRLIGDGRRPMFGGRRSSVVADRRALTNWLAVNSLRTGMECRYLEPNSVALRPQTRPADASPLASTTVSDADASGSSASRRQYTAGS